MSLPSCARLVEGGVELAVRVTPKAGTSVVAGTVRDAAGAAWLAVKVTEPADGGRANQAAIRLLARQCGVPPSAVTLVSGAAARWKRLLIAGEPALLGSRLVQLAKETA
ncbi:MAG TPA: DUF167 family protein [Geminicoccaceae bacterium]|nr:DUF167 family protein [Geminicoccus sp.]HMU48655.1 DUF167 family protein [Geminicoccaceae bacterium]